MTDQTDMLKDGLIWAFRLDGHGGGAPLTPEALNGPDAAPVTGSKTGLVWIHLDATKEDALTWLQTRSGLDHDVVAALSAGETRPRYEPVGDGALINLRGVNHNPGAEPEDMVAIRIWAEPGRVITTRRRKLMGAQDLYDDIHRGRAPASPGELVSRLALRLAERIDPVVLELSDILDDLEDDLFEERREVGRSDLAEPRSDATQIRRYVAPQREALRTLATETAPWMTEADRRRFREAADAAARVTEELEELRERAAILNDLMVDARAERMNRNMMILSVVAAVFLPLGLVAGLMGINVGGMPWIDSPNGFWYVTGIIAVLGVICAALFRLAKWI